MLYIKNEDLNIDERITDKWDGELRTAFVWHRVDIIGGLS
jgi:hypothetical protein